MPGKSITVNNARGSIIIGGNVEKSTVTNQATNSFHQTEIENVPDLLQLANELAGLREAMRQNAREVEHDISVSEIGRAEIAAREKDYPRVLAHLKTAGRWALKTAEEFGAAVAAELMKRAAGL